MIVDLLDAQEELLRVLVIDQLLEEIEEEHVEVARFSARCVFQHVPQLSAALRPSRSWSPPLPRQTPAPGSRRSPRRRYPLSQNRQGSDNPPGSLSCETFYCPPILSCCREERTGLPSSRSLPASAASTISSIFLYAPPASSASPDQEAVRT